MKHIINNGWFRLSVVISAIVFFVLLMFLFMILPDKNETQKEWYQELIACHQKNNYDSFILYQSPEYSNAQKNNNFSELIKLIQEDMGKKRDYFIKQCNLNNRVICDNVFSQFDCPYFYEEIQKKYLVEMENQQEASYRIYKIFIGVYVIYLALLLAIWWICLGFLNNKKENR